MRAGRCVGWVWGMEEACACARTRLPELLCACAHVHHVHLEREGARRLTINLIFGLCLRYVLLISASEVVHVRACLCYPIQGCKYQSRSHLDIVYEHVLYAQIVIVEVFGQRVLMAFDQMPLIVLCTLQELLGLAMPRV